MKSTTPSFQITDRSLTVIMDNKPFTMARGNASFTEAVNALRDNDLETLRDLLDTKSAINRASKGKVAFLHGSIYYNGEALNNLVTKRILEFAKEGLPFEPWMKFLQKRLKNPQPQSVDMLYKFMENENLPLTSEGDVVCYKGVDEDFNSVHCGPDGKHVCWKPGTTVKMPRKEVTFDPASHCSVGLHVGGLNFARAYGTVRVLVEVNPANFVSCPNECNEKARVCEARIISVCERDEPVKAKLVDKKANPYFKIRIGRLYKVMGAVYRLVAIEKTTGKHILRHHLSKLVKVNRQALKKASAEEVKKYLAKIKK